MNKAKRAVVIAGNWKMNKTPDEGVALIRALAPLVKPLEAAADVVVCVPFVDLPAAKEALAGTGIGLGAQNVHFAKNGAYTGEISAEMLLSVGTQYVIVGHSERRQYFGETDETVNLRLKAGVDAGLTVILCVGEVLAERENGSTMEVLKTQTVAALKDVSAADMKKIIIAYEPVWAIGTGLTATAEQADEACGAIRGYVAELYNSDVAEALTIQYGGSMNAGNAKELLGKENVDGGLIGGASLKAEDFALIVAAAE